MKLAEPAIRVWRISRAKRALALSELRLVAAAVWLLAVYRRILSPWLVGQCGWGCRFDPSCSHYAAQALRTHGFGRGLILSGWRLIRCNPLGGHGYDPVPPPSASLRSGAFWTHES